MTMRDISHKSETLRTAVARATLKMSQQTLDLMRQDKMPKGDPLPVAKVAAIQAAKNASQIIPYCHPIRISFVDCRFVIGSGQIEIETEVKALDKTGVEMEALTAASVAALTIYDMAKPVDEEMEILGVKLISKRGGKSDFRTTFERPPRAAVLVMSDSISSGKGKDVSGRLIQERLIKEGIEVAEYKVVPDEKDAIKAALIDFADGKRLDLIVTTGGTGFGPRDVTPEAMQTVIEREIPGIPEILRTSGQRRTPFAMLSRGKAGLRGKTIIVNLPGSSQGVSDSLDALFPALLHALKMIAGERH